MRTISATVSTREEAEAAQRRLEALGIDSDRILLKEVDEPGAASGGGGEPSIFVTVKVTPEQAGAAGDILKGGGAEAEQPLPDRDSNRPQMETNAAVPHQPQVHRVDAAAPSSPRPPAGDRSAAPAPMEPAAQPATRMERSGRKAATPPSVPRMAAIALLLAGLGFAVGAALGVAL